jgi:hypothetical protein
MKKKKIRIKPIRFSEDEFSLFDKIEKNATESKRSFSGQIKFILAEYYKGLTK